MPYGAPGYSLARPGVPSLPPMELPKQIARVEEGALWSTWDLGTDNTAKASTTRSFFGQALGAQGQGFGRALGYVETNMRVGGMIPAGLAFAVQAIAIQPYMCLDAPTSAYPIPATELFDIQNNSALQWSLYGSTIDLCPTILAGAGGGVYGSSADTGGAWGLAGVGSMVALNHGAGQVWTYTSQPLGLPAQQQFSLDLIFGASAAPIEGNGVANIRLRVRAVLMGRFAQAIATG